MNRYRVSLFDTDKTIEAEVYAERIAIQDSGDVFFMRGAPGVLVSALRPYELPFLITLDFGDAETTGGVSKIEYVNT